MEMKACKVFLLALCLATSVTHAYDRDRELLIAERLQERIKVGKPVWLGSGEQEFLAIHTEQMTPEPLGAIILLHGLGAHPDWPIVISPLRKSLPQRGWITVSIQLPVLSPEDNIEAYGKTLDEAVRRIDLTMEYLAGQEIEPVILLGYSFGGATAFHYVAGQENGKPALIGVAGVSALAQPFLRPPLDLLEKISAISIPALDIYGSRDFKEVVDQAADRRLAASKGENPWYEQIEIEGADHSFSGLGTVLTKRISGWLKKLITEYRLSEEIENGEPESGSVDAGVQ
ncbi:MAG: alpha/beta fold hydrolase [Gammaproteobacteria bacterium]|nr:alpha/beta fold hydrolase [Gammaproteobacteria bacterium]